MENHTVPVEEKLVIAPEKVEETTVVVPKKRASLSSIVISLLTLLVLVLGVVVFVLYNRTPTGSEPETVTPVTSEITVTPTVPAADTTGWLTYTDKKVGFSFDYPRSVLINEEAKGADSLVLNVAAEKLTDIPEDLPLNMGRVDALKQKSELVNAEGNFIQKIGTLNGQIAFGYSQFEICSVFFSRSLTFYPGEYRVKLTLLGPDEKIQADMPSFFKIDSANCGEKKIWDTDVPETFESTVSMQKGTGMGQLWYNTFYNVIDTLKLVTPEAPAAGSTYTNDKYGFEFTYDAPYKVLVSKDDLYGYPNGVALIYKGGQAYDIVVEAWDSKAAYEAEHAGNLANLVAFESKGKFITFYDNTQELGNKKIIGSVSFLP